MKIFVNCSKTKRLLHIITILIIPITIYMCKSKYGTNTRGYGVVLKDGNLNENLAGDLTSKLSNDLIDTENIHWTWFLHSKFVSKPKIRCVSNKEMKPIRFLPNFKNPCWKAKDGLLNDGKVHCLPFFYLLGVKKSATTDLFSRISKHPDICRPSFSKECQWISSRRFGAPNHVPKMRAIENHITKRGIETTSVEFYVSMFDSAAACIANENTTMHRKITVDASTMTYFMHACWEHLEDNKYLDEPRYTNFHFIKQLIPNAKFIIIFRDPVERLYSDFIHASRGKYKSNSPDIFHNQVKIVVNAYQDCLQRYTKRRCVYNNTVSQQLLSRHLEVAVGFTAGFHAIYMRDMIDVFGLSQIKPILMTEYVTNMEQMINSVFNFLELSEVDDTKMKSMLNSRIENLSILKHAWQMKNETATLLYSFYKPFNKDMAELMEDSRYLFS
ncbi:carbohydrate sulfotransferase 15-like [Ruditapes philippinarum]|uniref:carbohydrate sulfotransferase 15-like n=1 Tax=Ruditapes philippinarum TaxID=129788 RepID=UPI00295B17B2|nr:carbohydrate sulfotransferase 15-like [Ruditapes philippinarum]